MSHKNKTFCYKPLWRFSSNFLAVFALFALCACGLKTALQHDEHDLRPQIEWKPARCKQAPPRFTQETACQ